MTLADLERTIASQAPGALIPRDWVLDQIRSVTGPTDLGNELADLSVEQAGEILGRSTSTIRDYCRRGLLPNAYRQRGREWRVPRGSIRAFQRAEAAPAKEARAPRKEGSIDLGAWREEMADEAAA